jgi:hypothetical protein
MLLSLFVYVMEGLWMFRSGLMLLPQPLEVEQVLYRYLSVANPCFPMGLRNKE